METRRSQTQWYTKGQEVGNALSHFIGFILALVAFPFLLIKAVQTQNLFAIISSILFMLGMMICYISSALYHALPVGKAKEFMRTIDHNSIFIFIMATYAPYCLVGLMNVSPAWGFSIYSICVAMGITGIILNQINMERFKRITMILYILEGWLIVIAFCPLIKSIGFFPGAFLLLMGGVAYTAGALLYGLGKKYNQWFHFIFHILCLVGSILMYFSVYFYVIV